MGSGTVFLQLEGATDKESFCKAFIDQKMPEISEKYSEAEIHDESDTYGVIISIDECDVTLIPDKSLDGMTVFVTVK